jgi:pimeloyl-ACP methyl ester carboxylesterase
MMRTKISRRVFVVGLGAALAATTGAVASAAPIEAAGAPGPKPTVVLVHGGYADATISWTEVVRQVQKRGYPVIAPANRRAVRRRRLRAGQSRTGGAPAGRSSPRAARN